jgi:hypothetical protein
VRSYRASHSHQFSRLTARADNPLLWSSSDDACVPVKVAEILAPISRQSSPPADDAINPPEIRMTSDG